MKISIIIPVYNCKTYLPECVSSIQAAGFQDYEILLIDDGSSDGSEKLCDELAGKFSEIRVIHQNNMGVSCARNTGLQHAAGTYVQFVDADDTLRPMADAIYPYLEKNVDVVIFGMQFNYFHCQSFIKQETAAIADIIQGFPNEIAERFADLFNNNYFAPVWNKIIKRSVLIDNDIRFDTQLTNYEDLAFSLNVVEKSKMIVAVPDVCYLYRVDYDHDRTIERIAKIDDIMSNTDIIAESFISFEKTVKNKDLNYSKQIREGLLQIYFELFVVKMKTTAYCNIKRYCVEFKNNEYVTQCLKYVNLSEGQQRWYAWIQQEKSFAIWLFVKYLVFRHFCARNIKRIIRGMLK